MTTKEVIEKYYDCVNRSAWNDWLTLFTDDVSGDEQLAGHFEGIDVLKGAIGAISYGYSKFQMIPKHIVVEGNEAAVIWQCQAANRAGTPIAYKNNPDREVVGANYFRVEGGKIKYMRTIHDETAFASFADPTNPKAPPA
ncbi:MAG: nuclear transport factor 2 family protein [Desulfobaccales bacterium]